MTIPNAVDLSNYTVVPSAAQLHCLKDKGIRRAIVGTSYGTVWPYQIAAFETAGIEVQEYQFPGKLRITPRKVWLDCETPAATVTTIRNAAPKIHGIYTRRQWWRDETGAWDVVSEFPHLRLWEAHYGDPPPTFVPFGGWKKRDIIQYHDSTLFCGLNVDLNVIEEEQKMESFLCWCPDYAGGSVWFIGPNGGRWITKQTVVDDLAANFGPMIRSLRSETVNAIGVAP